MRWTATSLKLCLAATLLCLGAARHAQAAAAQNIPWVRNGSAVAGPTGNVWLTQETASQAGSMWNPCSFDISANDFTICTEQFFGDTYCGADGMTFTLQTGGLTQLGNNSGEHGYTGIGNSLAIALDTYSNPGAPYYDPTYHTFNLNRNGTTAFEGPGNGTCPGFNGSGWATGSCRSNASSTNAIISDNQWHTVCYQWNHVTRDLGFSFDGVQRADWILPSDYVTSAFGGNPMVYYGFTASTGGSTNYQMVRQTSGNLSYACQASPTPNANPTAVTVLNDCGATPVPTFTPPGPTNTPTDTPTPYPPGCGPPVLEAAKNLSSGCANSGNKTVSLTIPALANSLLLVHIEKSSSSNPPTALSYGAQALTLIRTDASYSGELRTYYLLQPAAGTANLVITMPDQCSWNVTYELYSGVDQSTPIGASSTSTGNAASFTTGLTALGSASALSDFFALAQADSITYTLGSGQVNLLFHSTGALPSGTDPSTGCCEAVFGSQKSSPGAGAKTMSYTLSQAKQYTSQLIEVRGYETCGTPTDTVTGTRTATPSATRTATATLTATPSASPTRSGTPTATPSPSPSVTPSATPSATPSPTPSATRTATASATPSPSPSSSPTATPSVTPSSTRTATTTLTATPSATPTRTESNTPGPSPTFTASPTQTATLTMTPTRTSTSSPTGTPTATPSSTQSQTPTPTITITTPYTATNTPTASPTSTASPSFTGSVTHSATRTATPSPTQSVTFTASASRTDSPTPTPSATVSESFTSTATPSVTLTDSPTQTVSPTFSVSPTHSPSPPPVPNHLTVTIYNSAGEEVLVLFNGSAQIVPSKLDLGAGALVNTDPGGLAILLPGALTQGGSTSYTGLTWLLTNDNGQKVGGGIYYVKAEYRDPFGAVTSFSKGVQVLDDTTGDSVRIYNSAGERVWSQDLTFSASALILPGTGSYAAEFDAAGAAVAGPLGLSILDRNGNLVPLAFDGRNGQGAPLAGGSYVVQVEHRGSDGAHLIASKSLVLLRTEALHPLAQALLGPNPARAKQLPVLSYPAAPGRSCNVDVFDLAGELIAHGEDPGQTGRVLLPMSDRASGVFVVRVRLFQNGLLSDQRVMKLALIH